MKATLFALFVSLLMIGCGEEAQKETVEGESEEKVAQVEAKDDPSVPLLIPCEACGKEVSKKTEKCLNCGHPAPDSVVAYKKAQELARIKAEEKFEKKAKSVAQRLGLDDHRIILDAVGRDDMGENYTGWVKGQGWARTGEVGYLGQFKDGKEDGPATLWHENGQKKAEANLKDGKPDGPATLWYENGQKLQQVNYKDGKRDGLWIYYNEDGTEKERASYKDGERVY